MNPSTLSRSRLVRLAIAAALPFAGATLASADEPLTPEALWQQKCASCHGPDGKGKTRMGQRLRIRDLTDPAVQDSFTDEAAFRAVREGVQNEAGRTTMKAVEGLDDAQINSLVAHMRAMRP